MSKSLLAANKQLMEQNRYVEPEQKASAGKKKSPSTTTKVIILIVLIALLAAGILLPIKLVPNAVSSVASTISSFFIGKKDVVLSADKTTINSGESFTISWNGKHQTNGTYALSYECVTGARIETSINQPNETVACGSSYYFAPNDNTIDLVAVTASTRYTDITINLGFLENGASTIDTLGKITVTITNPDLMEVVPATSTPTTTVQNPVTPTQVTPTPTPTTPTYVSNQSGVVDLEVRAIATGYLTDTGVFVPSNTVARNQQAAIKFQIINVGDKTSPNWTFVADLPSETDPRYVSGTQQILLPGDRIEYILGFKNMKNVATNVAIITVDPSNFVTERSKSNNSARMTIVNTDTTTPVTSTTKADLVVRMLDTGKVDRSSNTYTVTSTVSTADRAGVRFEIENTGIVATGEWRFHASLPTFDSQNASFKSESQPSLNPGEKRTYTVAFENIKSSGTHSITITVDADAQVSESNENNQASINIIAAN